MPGRGSHSVWNWVGYFMVSFLLVVHALRSHRWRKHVSRGVSRQKKASVSRRTAPAGRVWGRCARLFAGWPAQRRGPGVTVGARRNSHGNWVGAFLPGPGEGVHSARARTGRFFCGSTKMGETKKAPPVGGEADGGFERSAPPPRAPRALRIGAARAGSRRLAGAFQGVV
jgi:hypothetical protein